MGVITGGQVIPAQTDYFGAGAAVNGTNAVQTVTFTNCNGGTIKLSYDGHTTNAISWNATAATLLANLQAATDALPNITTNGIVWANSTLNAGNGAVTATFNLAGYTSKRVVSALAVANNSLTGTNCAIAICSTTTNGVNATALGALAGARYTDVTNGKLYVNVGADGAPSWAVQA